MYEIRTVSKKSVLSLFKECYTQRGESGFISGFLTLPFTIMTCLSSHEDTKKQTQIPSWLTE